MIFYEWLVTQRGRLDTTGSFAHYVITKKPFSKHVGIKLSTLLNRVPPDQRAAAKLAHREYRRSMREVAA